MQEGARVGQFTLIRVLGSTPHSDVWEAADHDDNRVAVKVLRTVETEPYQRFRDEVQFHRAGPYKGVLPVIHAEVPDSPSEREPAWFAMPIAETVVEALAEHATLDDVVRAVHSYAVTLAALAEQGIHHRDIKPANLFRLGDEWVVGDFGLVTFPGKDAATEPGQKLGPANFVAPEMVQDPTQANAGPADVWSLAKTLLVLAAGNNWPPPGQLRADDRATRLRSFSTHPHAAHLEPILEQATALNPTSRPPMTYLAQELQAWLEPKPRGQETPSVDEIVKRLTAISAPAVADEQQRADLDRAAAVLSDRLRAAHNRLAPVMAQLGQTIITDEGLILHGLGGKSSRGDVVRTWTESLRLSPRSPRHQVGLTVDIAWQRFSGHDIRLVAGIWLHVPDPNALPEVFMVEARDVRLETEVALQAADELVEALVANFEAAAARFAELVEDAEARIQADRQPLLECTGTNYAFRTEPESGVIQIVQLADNAVAHAVAWRGTPIDEIRADGDRAYVRAGDSEGWIERNINGSWVLAPYATPQPSPDTAE